MSAKSDIEWTDATWPIVQGCDPVSQACVHCYAVPLLWRMGHHPNAKIAFPVKELTEKHVNARGKKVLRFTGKIALREDRLGWPLSWRKPCMIFVPSHGDIFHKKVPVAFLNKIFDVMEAAHWHTFQVLTKRARRQREYVNRRYADRAPPANIWFMVSAEDQRRANERIAELLRTKAAVRGVSLEPLLGPVDLKHIKVGDCGGGPITFNALHGWMGGANDNLTRLDWVITGGESGQGARAVHPQWIRALQKACERAAVAFFFKQWGEWAPADQIPRSNWSHEHDYIGNVYIMRVGKKKAGRKLDGREYREFPPVHISGKAA